ncbi:hypothetical protein ACMVR0_004647 [Yersinia enterocolitica]
MDWQRLALDILLQFMVMTNSCQDSQSLAVKNANHTSMSGTTYEQSRKLELYGNRYFMEEEREAR